MVKSIVMTTNSPVSLQSSNELDVSTDGASTTDYHDASNESYSKASMQRQPLVLLCSRDAIRLYDLNRTVEVTV